jgi:hypothetical protein
MGLDVAAFLSLIASEIILLSPIFITAAEAIE